MLIPLPNIASQMDKLNTTSLASVPEAHSNDTNASSAASATSSRASTPRTRSLRKSSGSNIQYPPLPHNHTRVPSIPAIPSRVYSRPGSAKGIYNLINPFDDSNIGELPDSLPQFAQTNRTNRSSMMSYAATHSDFGSDSTPSGTRHTSLQVPPLSLNGNQPRYMAPMNANNGSSDFSSIGAEDPGMKSSTSLSSRFGSTYQSRSVSASSLLYYFKGPTDEKIPIGDDTMAPEYVQEFLDQRKDRNEKQVRGTFARVAFRYGLYLFLLFIVYFALIGFPLWNGVVYTLWKKFHGSTHAQWIFAIFVGWATFLAWLPLLFATFEQGVDDPELRDASETCLIIPAYKAADALPETIEHALKIFKPEQIFVMANGNSETPLDHSEEVCKRYGTRHIWVPIGSKITAEFVGVIAARKYKYAMIIDDDVHLPANLPLATSLINEKTKCIGYTITSTGANGSKGTIIQQCQDLEYKVSGMTRVFAGKYGSAMFPHGAIILWDRDVIEQLFWSHPGFHISEDWYFGHACRSAGYRIQFCSQVFVETETPPALFIPTKSSRGGYGEMTVFKQRFYRWNFFYVYRMWDDLAYLLFAWKLKHLEIVTKLYVFSELYNSAGYLVRPFILPIMLSANWQVTLIAMAGTMGMYLLAVIFFNIVHLRRKQQMVAWKVLPAYMAMKFVMLIVNTVSTYYTLVQYAKFFATRHHRVTDNHKALDAAKLAIRKMKDEDSQCEKAEVFQKIEESHLMVNGNEEAFVGVEYASYSKPE